MYQPNQSVTIVSAPPAYPFAPGLSGRINRIETDPVSGEAVYSVITTERVGTQPYVAGRGGDLYECHGLREADLQAATTKQVLETAANLIEAHGLGAQAWVPEDARGRLSVCGAIARAAGWAWGDGRIDATASIYSDYLKRHGYIPSHWWLGVPALGCSSWPGVTADDVARTMRACAESTAS